MKARVLIIDDDAGMRDTLEAVLTADGYSVLTAETGAKGLKVLAENCFDLLLLDLQLPDCLGTELVPNIKKIDQDLIIVMMTAYGTIKTAVEAVKSGVYEFVPKPFELEDMLLTIQNALKMKHLSEENNELKRMLNENIVMRGISGKSPKILEVFEVIKKVVNYDVTILITGESGTGKEVIAHTIHNNSSRRDKPFIKLNCAALPETLLESELFGYEKGAFTGATTSKPGRFELAEGGTLFLDEIAETTLNMQSKLLRVLQEKEFDRVGGRQTLKANVRIVCATNKNIKTEVAEGRFREDLFYRLNVITIHLPPLRERIQDIPEFTQFLLEELNQIFEKNYTSISSEAMACLMKYQWPGNIRELRNVLEKAMLLGEGKTITLEHLPEDLRNFQNVVLGSTHKQTVDALERNHIFETLKEANWNQTKASLVLGVHRNTLREKIRRHNISVPVGAE